MYLSGNPVVWIYVILDFFFLHKYGNYGNQIWPTSIRYLQEFVLDRIRLTLFEAFCDKTKLKNCLFERFTDFLTPLLLLFSSGQLPSVGWFHQQGQQTTVTTQVTHTHTQGFQNVWAVGAGDHSDSIPLLWIWQISSFV